MAQIIRQIPRAVSRSLVRVPLVQSQRTFLPARRPPSDPITGKPSAMVDSWFQNNDPFWPSDIQRHFDSLFRDLERSFFSPMYYHLRALPLSRALPVETVEQDGQRLLKIEVDLPDFKPEDVNVTVKKGEVIVEAKAEITEGNNKQFKQINYRYTLPEDADLDKVRSMLKTDGRLVIEAPLPALEAPKENREIPVKRE